MSQHTINITGVTTGITPQSGPPPRRSIFDVVEDPKAFSLLVQGLAQMQQADQSQAASHFQLSGIHGKPYVEWDGSGGRQSVSSDWEGYCTHGTVLFAVWHRPYVLLYEQILQAHVASIADKYTTSDKVEWQNAAANFRLCYWDWASDSVPPPQVISQKTVDIVVADGSTQTVTNPLFCYTFNPVSDGDFDSPWSQWNTTLRCPTDDTPDAQSDPQQLTRNLTGRNGSIAYQLKQATHIMLTQNSQWLNMSNHSRDINPSYASSLEAIHDRVHSYVGGPETGGHMSDPTVAAHDPIFFLHHCNVDRLLALWQAVHPDSFVPSSTAEDGTWVYPANSTISETTPLAPFWKDAQSYWDSDGCRDFTKLGYTYPEFVGQDLSNKAQLRTTILAKVNSLYGGAFIRPGPRSLESSAAFLTQQTPDRSAPKAAPAAAGAASHAETASGPPPRSVASAAIANLTPNNEHDMVDWRVRILTPKYKLGGMYSILVFLGPVPQQISEWRDSEQLVGTVEAFANIQPKQCANCRSRPDLIVEGCVYLNQALARSSLGTFEPQAVVSYLKENLHWRVTQKGQVVDITSQLPELNVSVVEVPIHFAPGDQAPHRKGNVSHHPTVTSGRPGGAQ